MNDFFLGPFQRHVHWSEGQAIDLEQRSSQEALFSLAFENTLATVSRAKNIAWVIHLLFRYLIKQLVLRTLWRPLQIALLWEIKPSWLSAKTTLSSQSTNSKQFRSFLSHPYLRTRIKTDYNYLLWLSQQVLFLLVFFDSAWNVSLSFMLISFIWN